MTLGPLPPVRHIGLMASAPEDPARAQLRAETRALAEDPADRAEMRRVMATMDAARSTDDSLTEVNDRS